MLVSGWADEVTHWKLFSCSIRLITDSSCWKSLTITTINAIINRFSIFIIITIIIINHRHLHPFLLQGSQPEPEETFQDLSSQSQLKHIRQQLHQTLQRPHYTPHTQSEHRPTSEQERERERWQKTTTTTTTTTNLANRWGSLSSKARRGQNKE